MKIKALQPTRMIGPSGFFGAVSVVLFATVANALPPQKIVGGTRAAPGEFPYMASIRYLGNHVCGGAIISPRHILTAAHCFNGLPPYMYSSCSVATGSVWSSGGNIYACSEVISHPYFNIRSSNWANDIAILKLAGTIAFDAYQASINLPTELVPEGVFASLTGWGYQSWDVHPKVISSELMKISPITLQAYSCARHLAGIMELSSSNICTLSERGVGACVCDSGGPLAYNGQVVGIVSRGVYCARGIPDVHTSVVHHVDWIRSVMEV